MWARQPMRAGCPRGDEGDQDRHGVIAGFPHQLAVQQGERRGDQQRGHDAQAIQSPHPAGRGKDDFRQPFLGDDRLTETRMREHIGANDVAGLQHVFPDAPMHAGIAIAGGHHRAPRLREQDQQDNQPQPLCQRRHQPRQDAAIRYRAGVWLGTTLRLGNICVRRHLRQLTEPRGNVQRRITTERTGNT